MTGIFINYRVGDEPLSAALIDLELSRRFHTDLVFRASKSIPLGDDFVEGLLGAVRRSDVLLAVIGTRWLTVVDRKGNRRIDDEKDWVRRELAEAINCGIRVIPILVAGATMPTEQEIPVDLAPLARCQYLRLDHRNIAYDCAHLADELVHLMPHFATVARSTREAGPAPPGASESLERTEENLASLVRTELEAEERQHRLAVPRPLGVWWSTVDTVPELSGWVHEIAEAYLALPGRRLVVLGQPGAGKTTLGILLALGLLRLPQPANLVPILLSLSSWDPLGEHLLTWIGRQLNDSYPDYAPRHQANIYLVKSGCILPILDGLDEIDKALRPQAIDEINRALPANRPLVLTCRTSEFNDAIAKGDVLTSATVIALSAVEPADAMSFLEDVTPVRRREKWLPVSGQLVMDPHGPVARALDTPLMVWLARTMYARHLRDPKELLDFADHDQIKGHLLDELVPTVFGDSPPDPAATRPPKLWEADRATQWLTFLASHLKSTDTLDLAWWELYRIVPHRTFARWTGMATALFSGPLLALYWTDVDLLTRLIWALLGAVIIGVGVAVIVPPGRNPIPVRIRFRSRTKLTRVLLTGISISAVFGALGGVVAKLLWGGALSYPLLAVSGAAVALPAGILLSLVGWLLRAISPDDSAPPESMSPRTVLKNDRAAAFVAAGIFTAGIGLPLTVVAPNGITILPLFLVLAVVILMMHAWGRHRIVATGLALSGRLPWRLTQFLDDAHRLGVLRQAGPVYQFRHNALLDRLGVTDDSR